MRLLRTSRRTIEDSWPLIARIAAFILGTAIIVDQTFLVENPPGAQDSLLALAIALMGPFGASLFAGAVERARGEEADP